MSYSNHAKTKKKNKKPTKNLHFFETALHFLSNFLVIHFFKSHDFKLFLPIIIHKSAKNPIMRAEVPLFDLKSS